MFAASCLELQLVRVGEGTRCLMPSSIVPSPPLPLILSARAASSPGHLRGMELSLWARPRPLGAVSLLSPLQATVVLLQNGGVDDVVRGSSDT